MAVKQKTDKKKQITETLRTELPKDIFNVQPKSALIHQVITGYRANQRISTASTKTRGEVSGGGKKPWRQKGTGRARHGSTRSPIWVGGGITFGPTPERNYKKVLPKQMRLAALAQVLSDRNKNKKVIVVDGLKFEKPKTKTIIDMLRSRDVDESALLITATHNDNVYKSARNVPGVQVVSASNVNAHDAIAKQFIVIEQPAVDVLVSRFKEQS